MRTIVPVNEWSDVDVPEDADRVALNDLVAAYQSLANRDQHLHVRTQNLPDLVSDLIKRSAYGARRLGATGAGTTYGNGDRIRFADHIATRVPPGYPSAWGWNLDSRHMDVPYVADTMIEVSVSFTGEFTGSGLHSLFLDVDGQQRVIATANSASPIQLTRTFVFALDSGSQYRQAYVALVGAPTSSVELNSLSSIVIKVL